MFHLGHPAHFHLFKNVIINLKDNGNIILILIKKKDVLEDLLKKSDLKYLNILPEGRRDNIFSIAIGQLKQDFGLLKAAIKFKPDLMLGTSVAISHVGKILNIPSINFNEDDAEIVPLYAKLAYPWATAIIAPNVCSVGRWGFKKIGYEGYHELAYLHPNHFKPNIEIVNKYFSTKKKYFIIRFAKLTAHHDKDISGINNNQAKRIIEILKPNGNIYITSEKELEPEFEKFRININPLDIHHVLAFASLYIGDSQTMAAEAGVLGVPFIRINSFVGRISYLNEIENKYKLGFGFKPDAETFIYAKIEELMQNQELKLDFLKKRQEMLNDKIDVTQFILNLIYQFHKNNNKFSLTL